MTPVDDSRLRECLLVLLIVGRGGVQVTHMACVVEKVLDECHLEASTVDANLRPTSWSALDCTAGAKRLLQNWTQQNQTTQFVLASNSNWHRRVTKIGQMFLYPFLSKLLLQRRYQHKHFVDDTQFTSFFRSRVCRYGDDIHPEFEDTRRVTCDRTHTRVCFLVFLL